MGKISAGKDYKDLAQGFGVCTIAVIVLYLFSGMNAVNLREMHIAILLAILTACAAFYVTSAFVKSAKRFIALVSAIPAFGIYFLVLRLSFNQANRETMACLTIMESVMLWAGLGTILLAVIALLTGRKFETKDAVTAVLCAGFVLRAVMVLFTPLNFHQHDVSNFTNEQAGYHDTYILFVYENFSLPAGDVRDYGQFYHPPLHYIISAIFLRIHNVLPLKFSGDINWLKMLPLLWTSYLVLFTNKILEWFDIKGKALVISLMIVVFCPQMIFLSIQVNNDALALMLFAASFFLALKWQEKPEISTILLLAVSIGCAMMTKLSMGFVAFPVAWIFLAKLIKTVKESKSKKPTLKLGGLIKQFCAFAALVFPLGLWFPLKNLIGYGTPITYVFVIDSSAGQDVWMYSALQRFLLPSKEILASPFLFEGHNFNDFNIPLALIKTALFDEREFTDPYLIRVGQAMLIMAFILVLMVAVCAVMSAFKRLKLKGKGILENPEYPALWILAGSLLISECIFCFKHPVACTQAFRYIAPVLIPAAVWSGSMMNDEKNKVFSKILMGGVIVFAILVVMFYGPFAQYSPPWEFLIKG